MLEMFRRDQFRQDLLVERCDELLALDERLQELDTLLAATVSARRPAPAARCACGAPHRLGLPLLRELRPAGRRDAAGRRLREVRRGARQPTRSSAPSAARQSAEQSAELVEALPAVPPQDRWES